MYLLQIAFENARENGTGELRLGSAAQGVPKWTTLPADPGGRELLKLAASVCGGVHFAPGSSFELSRLCGVRHQPLQVEAALVLHGSFDIQADRTVLRSAGIRIDHDGAITRLRRKHHRLLHASMTSHVAHEGKKPSWYFLLAYGPQWRPHEGTDDFDYNDPLFRLTRIGSLFQKQARLTDPAAFLTRAHYRGVRRGRIATSHILERLARCCRDHLDVSTDHWLEKDCDFRAEWLSLSASQRHAMLPALDAARHLLDAYPKCRTPLDLPALMLLDCPDPRRGGLTFARWAELMDQIFPRMQFVATLPGSIRRNLPGSLKERACELSLDDRCPAPSPAPSPGPLPPETILLWDVDSELPNLALMKLSTHFKNQGRRVALARRSSARPHVDAVYASCVFHRTVSRKRIEELHRVYGDALVVGGSGVDVHGRLPEPVEALPADYSLYPELGDRAIGFLTRGCPFHCAFCIVPVKEGKPRQVADLDLLLDGRQKLILLDDNILAHPRAADFLEEMARRGLQVNFSQSLDLRLVTRETVPLLKRIHCSNLRFTRRVIHFSLNDSRNLETIRSQYERFGFRSSDNVEFLCMYGFDTTLAEDVERFRFLRSLPGAYVFVQAYQPIPGGPPPNLTHFFDDRAQERIDELIRITFSQNMKSMENYYRWLARHYAGSCGKIHEGLMDTLFKYNRRQRRGAFLASLAELCTRRDDGPFHGTRESAQR